MEVEKEEQRRPAAVFSTRVFASQSCLSCRLINRTIKSCRAFPIKGTRKDDICVYILFRLIIS